ncbi:conserved hypothetical protein [Gammaproteobacteria bacterium]
MSVNKYRPHLLVIPEDDANRQIANGFHNHPKLNEHAIQILPNAGGWGNVVEEFENLVVQIRRFPERSIVLLVDFDKNENRGDYIRGKIPSELSGRVFVLGIFSEPEQWRRENPSISYERMGMDLAEDCVNNTRKVWGCNLLKHNKDEIERMIAADVKSFLFGNKWQTHLSTRS